MASLLFAEPSSAASPSAPDTTLSDWFDKHSTCLVNGHLAISKTVFENHVHELSDLCPHLPEFLHGSSLEIASANDNPVHWRSDHLTSCLRQFGYMEDCRVITPRVIKCGHPPSHAYAFYEVIAWLWHTITIRYDWRISELLNGQNIGDVRPPDVSNKKRQRCTNTYQRRALNTWPATNDASLATGRFLYSGFANTVLQPDLADFTPISMEKCADLIAETVAYAFGAQVDKIFLRDIISPLLIEVVEPSMYMARTIMRCSVMHTVLGVRLSRCLREHVHRDTFSLPMPETAPDVTNELLQELIDARKQLAVMGSAVASGDLSQLRASCDHTMLLSKSVRLAPCDNRSLRAQPAWHDAVKHSIIEMMLGVNVVFRHAPETIAQAAAICGLMQGQAPGDEKMVASSNLLKLTNETTLRMNMIWTDVAVDAVVAERVAEVLCICFTMCCFRFYTIVVVVGFPVLCCCVVSVLFIRFCFCLFVHPIERRSDTTQTTRVWSVALFCENMV